MSEETSKWPGFRFTLEEISGSFGDSITVIPLSVGIGVATKASLAPMLLFFALFQIAGGLLYRLPMPVELMKALAVLSFFPLFALELGRRRAGRTSGTLR